MAKKKKKPTRRRRNRLGALAMTAKSPMVIIGSIAAGFLLLAKPINNGLDQMTGTVDKKIIRGGTAGIGAALVFMKLGKPSMIKTIIGGILMGAGARGLATELGLMNGYGSVPVVGRPRVNGYGSVPVIGQGYNTNSNLSGALNGYKVPKPPSIMGCLYPGSGSGSGISNGGSEMMRA